MAAIKPPPRCSARARLRMRAVGVFKKLIRKETPTGSQKNHRQRPCQRHATRGLCLPPSPEGVFISRGRGGGVAEWLKAAVLKTARGLRSSWVRIPPPPPSRYTIRRYATVSGSRPEIREDREYRWTRLRKRPSQGYERKYQVSEQRRSGQSILTIHCRCALSTPSFRSVSATETHKKRLNLGAPYKDPNGRYTTPAQSGVALAQQFFGGNRQRTSSRNGILKADAVVRFAKALHEAGVEDFPDIRDAARAERASHAVHFMPGQGSGLSFDYLLMLAGDDSYVKPDRMLCRFVAEAAGQAEISPHSARDAVVAACRDLASEFPNLTPRLLDHLIWSYQRAQPRPGRGARDKVDDASLDPCERPRPTRS
jgi:hypothetical protein